MSLLLAACAASPAPPELFGTSAPPPACSLTLLGHGRLVLPPGLQVDGLDVGGLSALAYLGGDRYMALTDNQEGTPARVFELDLAVTPEGLGPAAGEEEASSKGGRSLVTGAIRLQGFDGDSLDAEGLAVTPSDTLLVASEKEPAIRQFSRDGRLLGSLPVPEAFLARSGRGVANNLGFESLALSPEGDTLWTGTERALRQDAPGAGKEEASPARLLRYRRTPDGFVPDGQFVYPVDPIEKPGLGFAVRGLSELLALPGGGLLALEREFVTGRGNRLQIYEVSTEGVDDVSALDSLAGRTVRPVGKTLLFDFASAPFAPENLEGMTLGPRLPDGDATLLLVSDDNFDPTRQKTHLVTLRLRCPEGRR